MRKPVLLGVLSLGLVIAACTEMPKQEPIADVDLGLSKVSLNDVPIPESFSYGGGDPGTNELAQTSYHTAPPMITHSIEGMVPIKQDFNLCKDCHVQPDLIGQPIDKGMPVPAPRSHYVENSSDLYMGRWNCTQCHRPQANVKLLVESTFEKAK